jgi:hypothetical protein
VDGLLVPFACSASHVAYNALRNEPIFMVIGEACGHAAHLAVQENVAPRKVSVDRLQKALVEDGGVITYMEDLESANEAFAACQWLGARGLNSGYRAETQKILTVAEGAERLRRILRTTSTKGIFSPGGDGSGPLTMKQVTTWLEACGIRAVKPKQNLNSQNGITVAEFAMQIYAAMAPSVS